ncbi:hypothetical protein SDC49_18525 [Lactobacillus sp. R2/2]|nr:hypothetical protein [Lactobacillus sp. R2/2]
MVSNIFYDLIHEDRLNDSSVKKKTNHNHHLKITLLVNQNEQLKVYEEIAAKPFPNDSDIKVLKPATLLEKQPRVIKMILLLLMKRICY